MQIHLIQLFKQKRLKKKCQSNVSRGNIGIDANPNIFLKSQKFHHENQFLTRS